MNTRSLKTENVLYLPGDGIGAEMGEHIPGHLQNILKIYNEKVGTDLNLQFQLGALGTHALITYGKQIPEETLEEIAKHRWIIKGPTRTPDIQNDEEFKAVRKKCFPDLSPIEGIQEVQKLSSANVQLRKLLNLYVCRRPVFHLPNVPTKYGSPQMINWTIFRENTEGYYGMPNMTTEQSKKMVDYLALNKEFEAIAKQLTAESDFVINFGKTSEHATKRLMREAIKDAIKNKKKIVTIVCKNNIIKSADGMFLKWCQEVAYEEFLNECLVIDGKASRWQANKENLIIVDQMITDNFFEKGSTRPDIFDNIVLKNLEGDFASDYAAGLIGGLGVAPGTNENPITGKRVYEATHGTADDIAGKNIVNPTSQLLSFHMMFEDMGKEDNDWKVFADFYMSSLTTTFEQHEMTGDLTRQIDEKMASLSFTGFLEAIEKNAQEVAVIPVATTAAQ